MRRVHIQKIQDTMLVAATVRDAGEEWHIECRWSNGEKGAWIIIPYEYEAFAHQVCAMLNAFPWRKGWPEEEGYYWARAAWDKAPLLLEIYAVNATTLSYRCRGSDVILTRDEWEAQYGYYAGPLYALMSPPPPA